MKTIDRTCYQCAGSWDDARHAGQDECPTEPEPTDPFKAMECQLTGECGCHDYAYPRPCCAACAPHWLTVADQWHLLRCQTPADRCPYHPITEETR